MKFCMEVLKKKSKMNKKKIYYKAKLIKICKQPYLTCLKNTLLIKHHLKIFYTPNNNKHPKL